MINYLIIDDEYIAHEIIKKYCELLPNFQLAKSCFDAFEAFEYLSKNKVDLIFLDLNLPKLKGFEFLKTLTSPPKIIVTTAYQEFALEGYELNVTDYLLKPFGFDRFLKAINKTFTVPETQKTNLIVENPVTNQIFLKTDKKYIQLDLDSVLYLEASGNYTKIVSKDETLSIREKISTIYESLDKQQFLQIHKSFVVAIKQIKSIEGNQIFVSDHVIPIGKLYKNNVLQLLK